MSEWGGGRIGGKVQHRGAVGVSGDVDGVQEGPVMRR